MKHVFHEFLTEADLAHEGTTRNAECRNVCKLWDGDQADLVPLRLPQQGRQILPLSLSIVVPEGS